MVINKYYFSFILLCLTTGCGGNSEPRGEVHSHTVPVPHTVAILMTDNQDFFFKNDSLMQHAYDRLESKTWHILSERAGVRVLERRNLEVSFYSFSPAVASRRRTCSFC